jgi:hypothetical protein
MQLDNLNVLAAFLVGPRLALMIVLAPKLDSGHSCLKKET